MTSRDLKFMTIGLGITVGVSALANVNIPHAFQAGTKIVAEQVNANFATLKSAVEALESSLNARQVRVGGRCEVGSSIREIRDDGTVVCETDDVGAGGNTISAGDGLNLNNNVLSVADAGISSSKLANNAVNSSHIADGTVGGNDLADGTVTSAKIAADAVNSSHISSSGVGTSEIANGSVGLSDLANDAVNSTKIQDGTITAADLGSNAINDSGKVADGSLRLNDLLISSANSISFFSVTIPAKNCRYSKAPGNVSNAAVGDIAFLEPHPAGDPLPDTIYTMPSIVTVAGEIGTIVCNTASTDFVSSNSFNVRLLKR